jgi:PH (Pleckstrin Homology) domain-containing protein
VTLRPRRARRVCFGLAAFIVILFVVLGLVLSGPTGPENMAFFQRSDRYAMFVLGLLIAAGILVFARPKIVADERHVVVRNLLGRVDVPWEIVRSVRFNRGSPWASLELEDDDLISLLALQAVDKQYAVDGVRALRGLLATHRANLASDAGTNTTP